MKWRVEPERLKPGAPNILIVLIDDVGFGLPDTFGGEAHTPTLSRLAQSGSVLQRLPYHVDLLAHASRALDRTQPSSGWQRHDR